MNRITEDDLITYSQVYDVYMLYSEEDKKRIPKKFVQKLERIVKNNKKYVGKIKSFDDLKKIELSKEVKSLISKMGVKI